MVVLFWLDPWEIFCFAHTRVATEDLWISCPALYHCATWVLSGFHLWQFQVLNSEAEGLVVVLFWLDPWKIFFLPIPGFEWGTSGSLVLHSTTVTWVYLVFTSDNFRYWSLVQRDWWWYCSDWTCERFSFCPFQGLNWGPLDLYSCTLPLCHGDFWFLPLTILVFNSGAEGLVVVLFSLELWEIFFLPTPGFELGTCGSLVLHSTTVPHWFLVFTSDNFRYLTLVQRDWWWCCSDMTWERFSFCPHQDLNWGPLDL